MALCLVLFFVAMTAWRGALEWAVPQFPAVLQQLLGWAAPAFAAGYLFARWRALRLVRAAYGDAAAAGLNKTL